MRESAHHTGFRRSAAWVAAAAGVVAMVTGCSGGSDTAGTPAPASSAQKSNTAWNPCSIPAADLVAAGLNPSKQVGDTSRYGTKFPGWDICGWLSDSWYGLNVYSTSEHTFAEVAGNTKLFRDPQPTTVDGRRAVLLPAASAPYLCNLAVDTATAGPVQFEVDAKASAATPGDSCAEVTRLAGALAKDLPR
ncbi:DUF3558 family protein [Nocardia wallacei]|uniref:DUF3558 family protein n=1 Tax=Nocardia wallacei TaxID=480035 RepID=UPI0024574811|nr:DUF3558 family protein [Nocardia wallacei]